MNSSNEIDVHTVIGVLAEVGPHGVAKHPATEGLDVFSYFVDRDLRRLDLSVIGGRGLNLDFRGADLRQAKLREMKFHGANFSNADLRAADVAGADFTQCGFAGTRLKGTCFHDASLTRCRFADIDEAPDLTASQLSSCEFLGLNFAWTCLASAQLTSDFRDCDLSGVVARSAQISGTWQECELSNLFVPAAQAGGLMIVDSTGTDIDISGATLDSVELIDCSFPKMRADHAALTRSIIVRTDLQEASLRDANLTESDLEAVNLAGADLKGADLTDASLQDVDFTGAVVDKGFLDSVGSVSGVTLPDGSRV